MSSEQATYTGRPAERKIDAVRLELGKDESLELLTDAEIEYYLARANQNVLLAASYCAESIAGMYAGLVDKSMGGSSASLSQKAEAWRKKAHELRYLALNTTLTPKASSSIPRKLRFWIGQHDNRSGYTLRHDMDGRVHQ